ncbi:MAG: hypothetical protein FJ398_03030 [Verrucomicrobia bacterium]|nr:hypothetical protein [Verrucomicrobiota bacterium]
MGRVHGAVARAASLKPYGRASLCPASQTGRVPRSSNGSPRRTRPTSRSWKQPEGCGPRSFRFMGNAAHEFHSSPW